MILRPLKPLKKRSEIKTFNISKKNINTMTLQENIDAFALQLATKHGQVLVLPNCNQTLERHINFWRALLLCFPDRYGSIGSFVHLSTVKLEAQVIHVPGTTTPLSKEHKLELQNLMRQVKAQNKKLTDALGNAPMRVQMQRPILGESVLVVLAREDPTQNDILNKLLFTAIHPSHGIDGYKVNDFKACPFALPKSLQDTLPKLNFDPSQNQNEDGISVQFTFATKLNSFLKLLVRRIEIERLGTSKGEKDKFTTFVREWVKSEAGNALPRAWSPNYNAKLLIPEAKADRDVLIWETFHTTCGMKLQTKKQIAKDKFPMQAKMTAFVDYVPTSGIDPELLVWKKYVELNAPMDAGAGSSRGTWAMFTYCWRAGKPFGLPPLLVEKLTIPSTPSSEERRKLGYYELTPAVKQQLKRDGYLVLSYEGEHFKIPKNPRNLKKRGHSDLKNGEEIGQMTRDHFKDVFRVVSQDATWEYENIEEIESKAAAAVRKQDHYFYYTDKISPTDPFNPDATSGKTHLAQGGGKYISSDSGMGPATTITNDVAHVVFTTSLFIRGIMSDLYRDGKEECPAMVVNLERFRMKASKPWKQNLHVDWHPTTLFD